MPMDPAGKMSMPMDADNMVNAYGIRRHNSVELEAGTHCKVGCSKWICDRWFVLNVPDHFHSSNIAPCVGWILSTKDFSETKVFLPESILHPENGSLQMLDFAAYP